MNNTLLNTFIVLLAILIIWFLLRLLFRKLVEPHKAFIHSPGAKSETAKLGYLATPKKSSGYDAVLVDDKKTSNKEVAEVFVVEDQNTVEFRNILLIDNSGSTAAEMDDYKKALKSFVAQPFSGEKNSIYTFSDTLQRRCDFTDSQTELITAIDGIQPAGATALNDALIAVADLIASQELLEQKDGKSIFYNIILFTDGMDNVSNYDPQEAIKRLVGKTLFAVCTKEADLNLMYEFAKNPRNVFIIGGTTAQSNLQNGAAATLEEALLKIRSEKLKGRGTAAYVQMKDEDNQLKIKGYVNVLGEIYRCGSHGEGAFFAGLCETPGSEETKVHMGNYIVPSRINEDYLVDASGPFGLSKTTLPLTPTAMTAGAWVIYQLEKPAEKRSKPENVLNAFPKVALLSLLVWCPIYLIYWLLKSTLEINIFGWLGKEFDITITQILLFFLIWTIISSLYVDTLRRKKGFMLFNDALNSIVGTGGLSKIIISLSIVGIVLSVLVFYPFSYAAFFVATLISFSANLMLTYGGLKTWFVNIQDPRYIPDFSGNEGGTKVKLELDYETAQGTSGQLELYVRSTSNSTAFASLEEAVSDAQSKNLIDYLENCVHITSIVNSYDSLSELMILATLGSLKTKAISTAQPSFHSPSEILLKSEVNLTDKLIVTLALFKEAAQEVMYTDDHKYFAFRTPNKTGDSPFIFENEYRNYYLFGYDDKKNVFQLEKMENSELKNWIKL
jgi:uncharacterized protein YegL